MDTDLGGGVAYFDNETWTIYDTSNSDLPNDYVAQIKKDKNGVFWMIIQVDGIASFEQETETWVYYTQFNSPLSGNHVRDIYIDSENKVWIGTAGNGLNIIDGEDWIIYDTNNSGLPDDGIRRIIEDTVASIFWIATNNGLAKFDGENWAVYDTSNSNLPSNYLISIMLAPNGDLWIGTWSDPGMLIRFDGENWTTYDKYNSPLPSDLMVKAISLDHNGDIWVGTDNGIAVISGIYDPTTSVNEQEYLKEEVKLYPNPVQHELTIAIKDANFQGAMLRVYNLTGQLVHSEAMQQHEKQLYLGAYHQGIYFVEISDLSGNVRHLEKVVVGN